MLTRILFTCSLGLLLVGPAEALSCVGVPDVTALGPAGCDAGPLTLSGFDVSPSAGFTAAIIGIGNVLSTADGTAVRFQVVALPPGSGDILMAYRVDVPGPAQLTSVDLVNNGILPPVTIGELVCRTAIVPGSTCAPGDRLAALVANVGEHVVARLTEAADPAFIFKDIAIGGFISDFTNSHGTTPLTPIPEPATLVLLASTLGAAGLWRIRRKS